MQGDSKVWLLFCLSYELHVSGECQHCIGECNALFLIHCSTADLYVLKDLKSHVLRGKMHFPE